MSKHRFRLIVRFVTLAFGLVAVVSACNFTPKETEDRNVAVLTSAAQTIDTNSMQLTMMAQSALLTSQAQTLAAPPPTLAGSYPAGGDPTARRSPQPPPVQTEPPRHAYPDGSAAAATAAEDQRERGDELPHRSQPAIPFCVSSFWSGSSRWCWALIPTIAGGRSKTRRNPARNAGCGAAPPRWWAM